MRPTHLTHSTRTFSHACKPSRTREWIHDLHNIPIDQLHVIFHTERCQSTSTVHGLTLIASSASSKRSFRSGSEPVFSGTVSTRSDVTGSQNATHHAVCVTAVSQTLVGTRSLLARLFYTVICLLTIVRVRKMILSNITFTLILLFLFPQDPPRVITDDYVV